MTCLHYPLSKHLCFSSHFSASSSPSTAPAPSQPRFLDIYILNTLNLSPALLACFLRELCCVCVSCPELHWRCSKLTLSNSSNTGLSEKTVGTPAGSIVAHYNTKSPLTLLCWCLLIWGLGGSPFRGWSQEQGRSDHAEGDQGRDPLML